MLARIVNAFALGAIGYWYANSPTLSTFVVALLAFSSYLALEVVPQRRTSARLDHDRRLYQEIRDLLSRETLEFLRIVPLEGTHDREGVQPIYAFKNRFNDTEHEFLDRRIQRKVKALAMASKDLCLAYGQHTFPHPIALGQQHVPPEWESELPDKWHEAVTVLNERVDQFLKAEADFTRTAKRRLYGGGE